MKHLKMFENVESVTIHSDGTNDLRVFTHGSGVVYMAQGSSEISMDKDQVKELVKTLTEKYL